MKLINSRMKQNSTQSLLKNENLIFSQPLVYCILLLFFKTTICLLSFFLPQHVLFWFSIFFWRLTLDCVCVLKKLRGNFLLQRCMASRFEKTFLREVSWLKKSLLCSVTYRKHSCPKATWGRGPLRLLLIRELLSSLIHLKFPFFLSSFLTQNWINCLLCT